MKKYRVKDRSYGIELAPREGSPEPSLSCRERMSHTILARHENLPSRSVMPTMISNIPLNNVILLREDGWVIISNSHFLIEIPTCPHCGRNLE